jgi:hypothetical protein
MSGLSPDQMRHALRGALTISITGSAVTENQADTFREPLLFPCPVDAMVSRWSLLDAN